MGLYAKSRRMIQQTRPQQEAMVAYARQRGGSIVAGVVEEVGSGVVSGSNVTPSCGPPAGVTLIWSWCGAWIGGDGH